MPYRWLPPEGRRQVLQIWPHRSLSRRGFVWFFGITAGLLALPALSLLGTSATWALIPFVGAALAALWFAIMRNSRDREIVETLTLTPELAHLRRKGPEGDDREWRANPYWLRVRRHETGGPVPHYLTLAGGPREVEIGAFLSAEERLQLETELKEQLARLRLPEPRDDKGWPQP